MKNLLKFFILTLFLTTTHTSKAQNFIWAKAMGGTSYDSSFSIVTDAAGNVYTTGFFSGTVDFEPGTGITNLTSFGSEDIFISKLDNFGNFVWAKSIGGWAYDGGFSITTDAAGNIYLTGLFNQTVDFDPGPGTAYLSPGNEQNIFICKWDASGNFVWVESIGGQDIQSAAFTATDAAGNVYLSSFFSGTIDFGAGPGAVSLTSAGQEDIFVCKLDAAGNFVWAKRTGGPQGDGGTDIYPDAVGNVYSTGSFRGTVDFDPGSGTANLTSAGNSDIFIRKLDTAGDFVWAKSMGGQDNDSGRSISIDAAGTIYSTGSFRGTADFDPGTGTHNLTSDGENDIFISKLNAAGNFVWAKSIGGLNYEFALSNTTDTNGNVYITGKFIDTVDFDPGTGTHNLTSVGQEDFFVCQLDSLGNFVWAKTMGGSDDDGAISMTADVAGNIYTTGYFMQTVDFDPGTGTHNLTSVGGRDIFILKLTGTNMGIEDLTTTTQINVYPNPTLGMVTINFDNYQGEKVKYTISDLTGKIVKQSSEVENNISVNLGNVSDGVYFLTVYNGNSRETYKIVKLDR
ncbi:MAG TPA: T9SS type A sorting domain-containing protein [Flavobacteriaceae bacterium]|nr:T9SS type A sorting domain-containing protein [Flavobacteriaceae bacterium]